MTHHTAYGSSAAGIGVAPAVHGMEGRLGGGVGGRWMHGVGFQGRGGGSELEGEVS